MFSSYSCAGLIVITLVIGMATTGLYLGTAVVSNPLAVCLYVCLCVCPTGEAIESTPFQGQVFKGVTINWVRAFYIAETSDGEME